MKRLLLLGVLLGACTMPEDPGVDTEEQAVIDEDAIWMRGTWDCAQGFSVWITTFPFFRGHGISCVDTFSLASLTEERAVLDISHREEYRQGAFDPPGQVYPDMDYDATMTLDRTTIPVGVTMVGAYHDGTTFQGTGTIGDPLNPDFPGRAGYLVRGTITIGGEVHGWALMDQSFTPRNRRFPTQSTHTMYFDPPPGNVPLISTWHAYYGRSSDLREASPPIEH